MRKLRFKGFSEKWQEFELGNIGETFTGLSGKTKEDFGYGNARYIPYLNIFNNSFVDIENLEKIEIDNSQNKIKYGDVFFTTSSETPEEVGMSSVWLYNLDNVYLNSFCFGYRLKVDIDFKFLSYSLRSKSFRQQMIKLAQGISRFNISPRKTMELSIKLPSLKEQEKIGELFKNLDESINKTELKISKLKQSKKALLDKLFTKTYEIHPQLRFKTFSEKWQEFELGNIGELKTSSVDKIIVKGEKIVKLLNYMDVYKNSYITNNFNFAITSATENELKSFDLKYGDILFTPSSETPDDIAHSSVILENLNNVLYSYHLMRLRPKINLNNTFAGQVFKHNNFLQQCYNLAQGNTRFTLSISKFSCIKVKLPSLKEQEKIGELFKALDESINLYEKKLSKLKQIKLALLEKIFKGE
ncbi:restriction endonuclease subunit S [Campylobacter sp. MG1]|uniref:restriction endonuclease subunit S n=1 Tax=Campylobacter sp. MG1 TaxID=2976332 RepID=UPI00226D3032|nr:restriction endonuclease subunit S [Campylobacter sp. MG1]